MFDLQSPYLNPARALGPAFVLNRWDNHWVYWIGPISGGAVAALLHTYVLSSKKLRDPRDIDDGDNSSMRSDEDTYDDLEKQAAAKFPGATYAMYRPVAGGASSLYSAPPTAIERVESLYGGTKSLYCKSPPLTRANLNRSQSVYAKSTSGRETLMLPKPGPLMPAQSLYPIRIGQQSAQGLGRDIPPLLQNNQIINPTQNHNSTNQNMQNQLQQCNQSIYGIRGITTSLSTRESGIYGMSSGGNIYGRAPAPLPERTQNPQHQQNGPSISQQSQQQSQQQQHQQLQNTSSANVAGNTENGTTNSRRPESMYGHVSRRSDDSAYGSYQGSTKGKVPGPPPPPPPSSVVPGPPYQYHEQMRPSPGPLQQNQSQQSYHRNSPIANSPNPQYWWQCAHHNACTGNRWWYNNFLIDDDSSTVYTRVWQL